MTYPDRLNTAILLGHIRKAIGNARAGNPYTESGTFSSGDSWGVMTPIPGQPHRIAVICSPEVHARLVARLSSEPGYRTEAIPGTGGGVRFCVVFPAL